MLMNWFALLMGNFGLAMFILALVIILIDWPIQVIRRGASFYEIAFRWIALLPLGATGIYTYVMHAFFPVFTAAMIGWLNSPFQFEVAMADLSIGLLGILSFRASLGFRLATVIASTVFLWGDAVGHIYQMLAHGNFTAGNAGSWFWLDIIIPLILILCLMKLKNRKSI